VSFSEWKARYFQGLTAFYVMLPGSTGSGHCNQKRIKDKLEVAKWLDGVAESVSSVGACLYWMGTT